MRKKSEKYARDAVASMVQSGFPYVEAQRIRPYLENAYLAGYKAGRSGRITLHQFEAEAVKENREVWAAIEGKSPITEDIILKNTEQ